MNDTIRAAREHNARALIHRSLSNESICEVFLALAASDTPSLARPGGWYLLINGLCYLWREIAMNFPELWARSAGSFPSKRMTDLAIQRARAADLSLDGHIEDHEGPEHVLTEYQLSLIETHAAHLHSLVHDDYLEWSKLFYRLKTFPRLEMARIWDDSGPDMWHECIETPCLRSLYMNNVLIPFLAPVLRYLRVDMDYTDWRRDARGVYGFVPEGCQAIPRVFPTREFISFLQCSPCLERLIITDMPYLLSKQLPTISELHAELPRLRALHLGGKSWAMGDFWQRLALQPETQVFIDTEYLDEIGDWEPILLEVVRGWLELPVYDSMSLGMTPSYDLLLQTWSSRGQNVPGKLDLSTSLGLNEALSGPAFTLRLPAGTRELHEVFTDRALEPRSAQRWQQAFGQDPFERFQDALSLDFHLLASSTLQLFTSSTLRYLDLTDLPFVFERRMYGGVWKPDKYIGRLTKPSDKSTMHVVLNWSILGRFQHSPTRMTDEYVPAFVTELTIVNFPCAAFPSTKRYDDGIIKLLNWHQLYWGLEHRHKAGYPPLSLRLAESTSDMSNMERSEEPEYVHTIEGPYEDTVRAVTEKGYQLIAPFVTSFEDRRVHTWP